MVWYRLLERDWVVAKWAGPSLWKSWSQSKSIQSLTLISILIRTMSPYQRKFLWQMTELRQIWLGSLWTFHRYQSQQHSNVTTGKFTVKFFVKNAVENTLGQLFKSFLISQMLWKKIKRAALTTDSDVIIDRGWWNSRRYRVLCHS